MTEKMTEQNIIDETTSMYDNLEDFGLSSYEARVFYAMLKLGFSSAREISNQSDVPFGRIYDVLGSLEDKELIEKQDSRPKRYAIKEPKFAVNNLLLRKKKELDSLTLRAKNLEDHLAKLYTRKPEEGLFWSVAVDHESIIRLLGKLGEAEEELLLYVDANINMVKDVNLTDDSRKQLDNMTKLVEEGVKVKILIGGITDLSKLQPVESLLVDYPVLADIPIRFTSAIANSFDVIDNEKVLLKISNPVNPSEYFATIYVWQKKFATELRKKFLQMWQEAEENR
jgi:sugar-specific transcriptional regulator TrmB